jgi:hypothetical protein
MRDVQASRQSERSELRLFTALGSNGQLAINEVPSIALPVQRGCDMPGIGNPEMALRVAAASSTKVAIEDKLFSVIQTHPDEIRLRQELRLLRLKPGDMCWCRITDVPRMSRGGWRPVIVESGNREWAVFTDTTSQLTLMSKQAVLTSPHPTKVEAFFKLRERHSVWLRAVGYTSLALAALQGMLVKVWGNRPQRSTEP